MARRDPPRVATGRGRKEQPPASRQAAPRAWRPSPSGDAAPAGLPSYATRAASRAGAPAAAAAARVTPPQSAPPQPRVRIMYVDGGSAVAATVPPAALQVPRLQTIKQELEGADDEVRRQGTELVTRLRVSFSAAYARRIDSAVTVGGYRREKEQLAADESSLEEEAARLEGVKADIKAGRATMDARAKAMRADEEALKRAKADLERRKGRFDASAEANEVHADQTATEAEDAKQEELFQQLLNIVRYQ